MEMPLDTLLSAAHLRKELGGDLFAVLASSDNTEPVRVFAQGLFEKAIPATMTVGGRVYNLHGVLRERERSVVGYAVVDRAKEMLAHLGQEEGEHLLKNQADIPVELQGKVIFIFTDWRFPADSNHVAYVRYEGNFWVKGWVYLRVPCGRSVRVLSRKS